MCLQSELMFKEGGLSYQVRCTVECAGVVLTLGRMVYG